MKASHLIKELQDQIEKHGDCDVDIAVEVEHHGWNCTYNTTEVDSADYVTFSSESNTIRIK